MFILTISKWLPRWLPNHACNRDSCLNHNSQMERRKVIKMSYIKNNCPDVLVDCTIAPWLLDLLNLMPYGGWGPVTFNCSPASHQILKKWTKIYTWAGNEVHTPCRGFWIMLCIMQCLVTFLTLYNWMGKVKILFFFFDGAHKKTHLYDMWGRESLDPKVNFYPWN